MYIHVQSLFSAFEFDFGYICHFITSTQPFSYLVQGTHFLPLASFETALRFSGEEDTDIDEVQCIIANLIDKVSTIRLSSYTCMCMHFINLWWHVERQLCVCYSLFPYSVVCSVDLRILATFMLQYLVFFKCCVYKLDICLICLSWPFCFYIFKHAHRKGRLSACSLYITVFTKVC